MPTTTGPARRTLVKGAAWSTPLMVVGAPALGAAASGLCVTTGCTQSLDFGTVTGPSTTTSSQRPPGSSTTWGAVTGDVAIANWRTTGVNDPNWVLKGPGYRLRDGDRTNAGNWFGVGTEPAGASKTISVTRNQQVAVTARCTNFYLTAVATNYVADPGPLTMTVALSGSGGQAWTYPVTSTTPQVINSAIASPSFTLNPGNYTVSISMTVAFASATTGSNDLYVRNLQLTCGTPSAPVGTVAPTP